MSPAKNPAPGTLLGSYPERQRAEEGFADKLKHHLQFPLAAYGSMSDWPYRATIKKIDDRAEQLSSLTAMEMAQHVLDLRQKLSLHGLVRTYQVEVLATVKVMCLRVLGVTPYHTQVAAALIMLDGKLAEMATGEGKTLAAAVCVAAVALSGTPIHVITSNDYLVTRDAEKSQPLYAALGLSVGTVTQDMDAESRRRAYACDITYCTAKELVFDYLRDRAVGGAPRSGLHERVSRLSGAGYQPVLRGLCMAIIDEADSILIDEARVPLILSQNIVDARQVEYYHQAHDLARQMQPERDYQLNHRGMQATLTEAGRDRLEERAQHMSALWRNRMHREEAICQALAAQHLFKRDKHYLVRDDQVHIIDEITGRLSPGRVWSRGLHQLIEIKENCKPSGEMLTAAQITFQRFFPRYHKLGGMSGTISESRAELFSVYRLKVVRVPLRQPSRRQLLPTRIFKDEEAQWKVVVEHTRRIHESGRPVLIGTDSVAESEHLSRLLDTAGLAHKVLNARQDQDEAMVVARAGNRHMITVSTNMAGRGTDIPLGPGVEELGGLHLIICQHNPSRRIDRQLLGRCARQGNPGSAETLISFQKPQIARLFPRWLAHFSGERGLSRPQWLVRLIIWLPQWLEESHQRAQRKQMLEQDARLERATLLMSD